MLPFTNIRPIPGNRSRLGYTLAETMITMAVLSMLAVGLFTGAFIARSTSIQNARYAGVSMLVDGVVRQIANQTENALENAITNGTVTVNLPTVQPDGSFGFSADSGGGSGTGLVLDTANSYQYRVSTRTQSDRQATRYAGDEITVLLTPSITSFNDAGTRVYNISVDFAFEGTLGQFVSKMHGTDLNITTATAFGD